MLKKIFSSLVLSVFIISSFGCVVYRPHDPPPAPRRDIRTPRPGPKYFWVKGHWEWRGGKYVWVNGHWSRKKPGKVWVAGHWEKRGGRWIWVKGHWRRR